MKLPKSISLLLFSGACLTTAIVTEAGPRFAGGDLTFLGTASATDSNRVSPNANAGGDTYFTFTPAIQYFRESNRMNLNANLSFPMRRYDETDALDSDSIDFNLNGEIPFGASPKLSGTWGVTFFDGIRQNYFTNNNLNSEHLHLNAYADYIIKNRLSFRTRAMYSDRSSTGVDSAFTNANTTTVFAAGLHARELIRGRIGLYAEYQIRDRETDRGAINQNVDASESGLNFGITGQVLPERLFPKLEADLSFGFTSSSAGDRFNSGANSGSRERLTLDGRLAYPASTKTNVTLTYRRNLNVTDDDRTVESSEIDFGADYTPNQKLQFATALGLRSNEFIYDQDGREDDIVTFTFDTRYTIRTNWFANLNFDHRMSDSNEAISDYDTTRVTLSTTIAY
ncbi:outer membrane beta-barrel protein [Pelagicoccus sp. SDUM812002]|uniref:outer membrane beta-barrel protein n=1 Tax=Pelagicoccus sp. SDUM812002 TaxID=3041266 RepID=UPI00280E844B|nr:outer membrane beta-barrel protein [Pelagicoccus sp. SDUM812002]MDQ8184541.1 outer membrane beta-barrel protein [Pelagicoccus sp. SDUM812002]